MTVATRDGWTGGGLRADVLVLAGVLPHGVWRGLAVRSPVPADPEEWLQRGLFHQGVPCAAHSQHPAHLFLVRTTTDGQTRHMALTPGVKTAFYYISKILLQQCFKLFYATVLPNDYFVRYRTCLYVLY